MKCYDYIQKPVTKLQHPPEAPPRAFEFLENICSNAPLPRPKSCSNAPTPEKLPDYCFNFSVASIMLLRLCLQCTGQFQSRPSPPGQTPWHLTFLKTFGQIPRYVASLDFQMPHPLELQRGSNPPPSRHVKATVETSSATFSATTNFLFSLSSLHTLNKDIFHDIII